MSSVIFLGNAKPSIGVRVKDTPLITTGCHKQAVICATATEDDCLPAAQDGY